MIRPRCLLLALALLAALPSTAGAVGVLDQTAAPFADTGSSVPQAPGVVLTPDGEALVAWSSITTSRIAIASRPPGGPWRAPQDVSPSGSGIGHPALAVSPAGEVALVYDLPGQVVYQVRPAGSTSFSAKTVLDAATGSATGVPQAAYDAAGNLYVAWQATDASSNRVVRTAKRPAGGAFGSIQPVSPSGTNRDFVRLTVNAAGTRLIVFRTFGLAQARFVAPDGTLGAIQDVGGSGSNDLDAGLASDGSALTVLDVYNGTPTAYAERAPFSFATASTLDAGASRSRVWALGVQPSGAARVLWQRPAAGGGDELAGAFAPAGGSFGAGAALGSARATAEGAEATAATGASGQGLAAWLQADDGRHIGLAWSAPDAPFSALPALDAGATQLARNPTAAVGPTGDGVVAWSAATSGSSSFKIFAAFVDATPPALTATLPATATAGQPAAFAAGATDGQGGAVALSWDFGDGKSAVGASVSHTYVAPGFYTATVVATDASGNRATQTGRVTVSAPPAVPGPRAGPAISGARLSPSRFRVRRKGRGGATLRLRVSAAGTLTIAVRACRNAACTQTRPIGTLRHAVGAGSVKLAITGRVGRRTLKPGRYRADLTVTDAAGHAGAVVRLRFTVNR